MPKAIYIVLITFLPWCLSGVVWHMQDNLPLFPDDENDAVSCLADPSLFADTLCFVSGWSPGFREFGIREGLIYAGTRSFSLSFMTQYHRLMANHVLSAAFPVLKEEHLRAGLEVHYGISAIPGLETLHGGSCSGSVRLVPHPQWQVLLRSRYALSFPREPAAGIFESETLAGISYAPLPFIRLSGCLSKRAALPWKGVLQMSYLPGKALTLTAGYDVWDNDLALRIRVRVRRWEVEENLRLHPVLGISHLLFIAYAY